MRLTPGGRNLWVGLVGEQTKVEALNTIAFAATAPSHEGALTQLLADTSSILDRRLTGTGVILMRKSKALK